MKKLKKLVLNEVKDENKPIVPVEPTTTGYDGAWPPERDPPNPSCYGG